VNFLVKVLYEYPSWLISRRTKWFKVLFVVASHNLGTGLGVLQQGTRSFHLRIGKKVLTANERHIAEHLHRLGMIAYRVKFD
jgi:hypothetical protein